MGAGWGPFEHRRPFLGGLRRPQLTLTSELYGRPLRLWANLRQFQGLQFALPRMEIELQAALACFLRQGRVEAGHVAAPDANRTFCAMAKRKFVDRSRLASRWNQCLQLHAGYGLFWQITASKSCPRLLGCAIVTGAPDPGGATNEKSIARQFVARDMFVEKPDRPILFHPLSQAAQCRITLTRPSGGNAMT